MALTASITNVVEILTAQPLLASASNMTSAQIISIAAQEEWKIWAKLGTRYDVPMSPPPPPIQAVAVDLTCYALLTKQALLANSLEDSPWPKAYKEAWQLVEDMAVGKAVIVTGSGTIIPQSTARQTTWFSSGTGLPTFTELPIEEAQVDPDKLDDLRGERGL